MVLLITGVFSGTHLSWSNSTVWVADARRHIGLTLLLRTHRHTLVIDNRPLIGTLARAACETLAHAACGTQLTWPTITSSQRCPRNGRYICVPNNIEIKMIVELSIHLGTIKVYQDVKKIFCWPKIKKDVIQYVTTFSFVKRLR